jgi:hypothetical protein
MEVAASKHVMLSDFMSLLLIIKSCHQPLVVHVYIPSYSEGRDQEDRG